MCFCYNVFLFFRYTIVWVPCLVGLMRSDWARKDGIKCLCFGTLSTREHETCNWITDCKVSHLLSVFSKQRSLFQCGMYAHSSVRSNTGLLWYECPKSHKSSYLLPGCACPQSHMPSFLLWCAGPQFHKSIYCHDVLVHSPTCLAFYYCDGHAHKSLIAEKVQEQHLFLPFFKQGKGTECSLWFIYTILKIMVFCHMAPRSGYQCSGGTRCFRLPLQSCQQQLCLKCLHMRP
jgi:hypothetical protein